jgi:hypothetical protein
MAIDYPLPSIQPALQPVVGFLGIRKYDTDIQHHERGEPYSIRCWRIFRPFLHHESGQRLIAQLQSDPRIAALDKKLLSTGSGGYAFDFQQLALWYLWLLNRDGKGAADLALERYLDASEIHVWLLLGLEGLELASSIKLFGFEFLRVESLPESDLKWSLLPHVPTFIFNPRSTVSAFLAGRATIPKTADPDKPEFPSHISDWYRDANDLALIMSCLPSIAAIPAMQTSLVDDTTPNGPFSGSGAGMQLHGKTAFHSAQLDSARTGRLVELWEAFTRKNEKDKTSWRHCLWRLTTAKTSPNAADQALDLGIALEMILQKDNPNREQLSLAFRLRGAWLLEPDDAPARRATHDALRDVYEYRSEVAHTGRLDSTSLRAFEESKTNLISIAERIACEVLRHQSIDWPSIILAQ